MFRSLMNSFIVLAVIFNGNVGFSEPQTVYQVQSPEYKQRFDDYNNFLLTSGFDDIAKEIAATLAEAKSKNKSAGVGLESQEQLEFSKERYELINLARIFSAALMATISPRLNDQETQDKIVDIATKFITLRPIPDPIQDSSQIPANLNTPEEIAKMTLDYKVNAIKVQAERFISDIANLLYGREEVKRLLSGGESFERTVLETSLRRSSEFMVQYLARINSDLEMGQARELGSALALLIVRHARLNSDKGLEHSLRRNFKAVGEPLEKHIVVNEQGDKISDGEVVANVVMVDEKGQDVQLKIKNGDILGEFSDGSVAAQIAAAVRPHPKNFLYALRNGLWGYMLNVWVNNIKTSNGKLNSFMDRIKEILKSMPFATRGISHGGQAWVITSHVTDKLRLGKVRVTDMYNHNHGGIRFTDLQFAIPGVHKRFIISSYDAKKYAAFALEQIAEIERTGIIPPAWITKTERLDSDGTVVADNRSKRVEVPADITVDELRSWKTLIKDSPEKWFYGTLMPRIQKEWRRSLVKDGMTFAHNLKDTVGSAACFKQMIMNWKKATGLEPRMNIDRLAIPVKLLAAVNSKMVEGIDLETIAAPATLNWQEGLVEKTQTVTFKNSNEAGIQLALRSVGLNERDPELTQYLRETDLINQMVKGLDEKAVLHAFVENLNYHDKARSKSRFDPFHKDAKKQEVDLSALKNKIGEVGSREFLVSGSEGTPAWIKNLSTVQLQSFLDKMLRDLGYLDYVTPTEKTLKDIEAKKTRGEETPHEINVFTLKDNAFRYKAVNSTRDLTKLVMEKVYRHLDDPAVRGKLAIVISKLLATKPTAPPPELPDLIKNLPARNAKEKEFKAEKADGFLFSYAKDNIYDHTRHITADLVRLVYTPEQLSQYRAELVSRKPSKEALEYQAFLERVYSDAFTYVRQMYLDPQTGQTRWLGRQMYQTALWYARQFEGHKSELEKALYKQIKGYNLDPEIFSGDELVLRDRDGSLKKIKVNTGDAWTSLSKGTEAVGIKHGASTHHKLLLQVLFDAYAQIGDNNVENGQNMVEKLLHSIAELAHHNKGISHVGGIEMNQTPDGLVKNTLLYDNYPYENDSSFGGFRIAGPEHMFNGPHNKGFGITSYDIKEIFKIFKTLEYREEIWEAFEPKIEVSEGGEIDILPQAKPKPHNWKTRVSKEKFQAMQNGTLEEFEPWFHKQLKHGAQVFITEMGVFFNWVNTGSGKTPNGKFVSGNDWYGGVYCSATLHIQFSMFTQMTLAFGKSDWSYFTKLLHKLGVPGIKEMNVEGKILTPDEVMEAPFSKERISVLYDPRTIGEMESQAYASVPYLAEDRKVSEDLKAIIKRPEVELRAGEYDNLVHAYTKYIASTLSDKGLKLYPSLSERLYGKVKEKLSLRTPEKRKEKINTEELAIFKSHDITNTCKGLFQ